MERGNSDYDAFPSRELQVAFDNVFTLAPWNKPIHGLPWSLIVPVRNRFANSTDAH